RPGRPCAARAGARAARAARGRCRGDRQAGEPRRGGAQHPRPWRAHGSAARFRDPRAQPRSQHVRLEGQRGSADARSRGAEGADRADARASAEPRVSTSPTAKAGPGVGRLWVIAAPSGAGKTSLVRALLERDSGLRFSISYTTRPRRSSEVEGRDYFFVTEERFLEMVRDRAFLEHARVFDHWY